MLPDDHDAWLASFPVGDLWGIGPSYAAMLRREGIEFALDLIQTPDKFIREKMTVVGARIIQELRGISCLALEEVEATRKRHLLLALIRARRDRLTGASRGHLQLRIARGRKTAAS